MNYREILDSRLNYLQKLLVEKEREIKLAPEGKLKISKHNRGYQYYIRKDAKDVQGKYINKSNMELARKLAQKDYNIKLIALAEKEQVLLKKLTDYLEDNDCGKYFSTLPPQKAELITPLVKPEEEFIAEWLAKAPKQDDFMEQGKIYDNGHGVYMRSKSEVIISRILDDHGIPYIYEKSLQFSKFKTVRPDFTILDVRNRREIYIEHLGMMDDNDYLTKNIKKIADYEKAGIYLGARLLITYETKKEPLDTHLLEEKLLKML